MVEEITMEMIETKVDNGEALTAEEEKVLMGAPAETDIEEEVDLEDKTGIEKPEDKEKEDTDTGKDEKKPEEKEADTDEAADKKSEIEEEDKDIVNEVEKNLDTPDSQIELSKKYTDKEKALFWEYRRAKKRAQTAEAERDALKIKAKIEENAKQEKPEEPKAEEDDEEYLTKKQVKELLRKETETIKTTSEEDKRKLQYDIWCEKGRELFEDFDEVMEVGSSLIPLLLKEDPNRGKEIRAAYEKRDNVATIIYDMIKQHPKYGKLFPDTAKKEEDKPKSKEAEKTKKRIEENEKKPKTSGAKGAGGGGSIGEYTIEEISKMSLEELEKIPAATREKILMAL